MLTETEREGDRKREKKRQEMTVETPEVRRARDRGAGREAWRKDGGSKLVANSWCMKLLFCITNDSPDLFSRQNRDGNSCCAPYLCKL